MGLVGYLPEGEWEVIATALGVVFVALGLLHLIGGRAAGVDWPSRIVRVIGAFQIALGIGVVIAGFRVNAEPPCGACGRGHWGHPVILIAVLAWLAGLIAISVRVFRRYRR